MIIKIFVCLYFDRRVTNSHDVNDPFVVRYECISLC